MRSLGTTLVVGESKCSQLQMLGSSLLVASLGASSSGSASDAACEHCEARPADARFDGTVNHYIAAHGYRLLHVGSESRGEGDQVGFSTVAVLGK
jgi:hypothetical protein